MNHPEIQTASRMKFHPQPLSIRMHEYDPQHTSGWIEVRENLLSTWIGEGDALDIFGDDAFAAMEAARGAWVQIQVDQGQYMVLSGTIQRTHQMTAP